MVRKNLTNSMERSSIFLSRVEYFYQEKNTLLKVGFFLTANRFRRLYFARSISYNMSGDMNKKGRSWILFVSFSTLNRDNMKKLNALLACLVLILSIGCMDDEIIEEQVFKQENINPIHSASGEEGDQKLDRNTRD